MKRIKIVIAFMLGLVFIAPAQTTFYKQYDLNQGSAGYSLQPTDDGGAMIVGSTTLEGQGQQMLIMKINETGDTLWTKTYGEEGDDHLECINNTSDGNFIVSGYDDQAENDRVAFVAKLNPEGDTLWTLRKETSYLTSASVKSIIETYDNNYVFVYNTSDYNDQRMIKVNESGEQIWEKQYIYDSSYDFVRTFTHVQELPDHSLVVMGKMPDTTSGIGFTRVFLMKTNEDGVLIWEDYYAGEGIERSFYPNAMDITSDSGIVVTGTTTKYPPSSFPGNKIFYMKIDSIGEQLWTNNYGTGLFEDWDDAAKSIIESSISDLIITGQWVNAQGTNTFLINTTPTGEQQWMDTYLLDNWSSGYCVRQSDEEHLMVTGASGNKLIFLKTNMDGEITSSPSSLAKKALKVYPNPARDYFHIKLPVGSQSVKIITMTGKTVYRKNVQGAAPGKLTLHDFEPGYYLVRVQTKDGRRATKVLVL